MEEVKGILQNDTLTIALAGRIDSGNAEQVEEEIRRLMAEHPDTPPCMDLQKLDYISSAGLRSLLRIRKQCGELRLINVSSDVYEILEMTGFTELMTVEKAYREVSVEGCEVIGQGANGTVYRIDGDNVVKVYNDADALDDIQHEREVARLALILGIPTAISYDVVRVGDGFGSVFELLDAQSFSKILANEPEKLDWCVDEYVKLLRKIHDTVVPEGRLPDMRETAISWGHFVEEYLPEEAGNKLVRLIEAVPYDHHMIHGDYHTKNIQLTGGEVLLIDMDTLAIGHPVFELASMFNAFVGFGESDPERSQEFMGIDRSLANDFWHRSLATYLGTQDERRIKEVEDKARIVGYTRLIRRSIRRQGLETEKGRAEIDHWKENLLGLLEKVDSLVFTRNEMIVPAEKKNLPKVMDFVCAHLDEADCGAKARMQTEIAVEEIYINVAYYAYKDDKGDVTIRVETDPEDDTVTITFIDQGVPYDPVSKEDPDVSLPMEERQVGGLGIFMVRNLTDDMQYEYRDGKNILTLKKSLH